MADAAFDIKSDSPANDELLFWSIVGHECLSRPSFYELTVLSRNQLIDPKDILGKAFNVGAYFKDAQNGSHERRFQGHAVRIVRGGQMGRYFQYHISLRSWVWLLSRRTNSRIFQDKTVLEIIDAVMEDSPIKGFKKTKLAGVIGAHKPRRYCTQHAETDYQFVNRLLEDEGVYYWFDSHDQPGTMVLADSSDVAHAELPAGNKLQFSHDDRGRFNEITQWVGASRLETGMYTSADYDYEAASKMLSVATGWPEKNDLADFEMFESPGGYATLEEGEARAALRSEEASAKTQRNWALTAWPDVAAGHRFTFEGSLEGASDGDYLIAGCTFIMSHAGYEGVTASTAGPSILGMLREALNSDVANADTREVLERMVESTPSLRTGLLGSSTFLLTVLPLNRAYRPARLTPRTLMSGPQSAVVVGAQGKEIDVDEFGRVKVQFHWDRYGEKNEKSSCWLRVSQPMAGNGWGGYFAPRIGQEVIVDFLNADPDKPLVVGRVYNDDQPIPFQSPTESGFRTHSTPGGTAKQFNELRFDDKAGAEELHMRAQRRMDVCVEQNYYEHIKGASSSSVGGTQLLTVGHKQHLVVKNKQYVKVDDDAHWLYMGDVNFGISKSLKLAATSAIEMTGGNVHIEASQKLVLQCGSSIIRLSPGGIEIEGPLVRINCGAAPAAGSSPNVVAAKEAGGSKCAEGKDKAPEPKKKPVPPPPKDERKKVPPPPDEERKKVPPPPDDNPKKFPPVIIVPIPAQVLCVSLHEIVEFGDAALAEIDALIEELDDATSEVLDQAENLSQDAVQRCADKVTAAQATMHDAKKEIANAQKAACEQLSTAGAQAQKLTQNVNNGVNKAMAKANSAVADPTVQDIMGKAGVANDVNKVARDANQLNTDAQNTVERARADALAASTDAVNTAGKAVDGAAQDVLNEADAVANTATEAAGDAHRAISKASDEARKALQAAKAAAQAAIAAARAAMAMADVDVCVPIPGLSAMMAAARAEMEHLAAMAKALVKQGKEVATKGLDAAKKGVDDAEKALDDAEKVAKDAAEQVIDEAERIANEAKQRAEQLAKEAEDAGQKVLDEANQRVNDIQKRVEDAAKVAQQQAQVLMQQGQQTVADTVSTIKNEVARAQAEAMKALDDLKP